MKIGDIFKNHYPQTSSISSIVVVGLGFLAISNISLFDTSTNKTLSQVGQIVGGGLLCLFLIAAILETLVKFSPVLKGLLNFLLELLIQLLGIVSDTYVTIVRFLIKKAVVSILEEKGNIVSESFSLKDADGNDQFWNRVIKFDDIKTLELVIKPSSNSNHWRIGFKFSETEVFPTARFATNHPLLHLTKDSGNPGLRLDYYNENSKHDHEEIFKKYDNEKLFIKMFREKGIRDVVTFLLFDENNKGIYENKFRFATHKYGQLSTWGDGKGYEFEVKQYITHI